MTQRDMRTELVLMNKRNVRSTGFSGAAQKLERLAQYRTIPSSSASHAEHILRV